MKPPTGVAPRIPVSRPVLGDTEIEYVTQALRDGAVSGFYGEYLGRFETEFAAFCGTEHGIAASSGTAALHLALAALSIGPGDEVLVSTLTNMATVFAILYQRATPILIDIDEDTWNLDPALLERHITPNTRAIVVVHLFGHPVDMDPVMDIARRYDLKVVEDCAEAHGARYNGQLVGSVGDMGCFSFYANKIITTGEGGMVTTDDRRLAERVRSLRSLAFGARDKFMHAEIGFNYRMTNVQAALGCAQLRRIDAIIDRKRQIAGWYAERLLDLPDLQLPVEKPYARNVYWMYHIGLIGASECRRRAVMNGLAQRGIETREGFIPANLQDIFRNEAWALAESCPKATRASRSTLYLPSAPDLSADDVDYIATALEHVLRAC